MQDGNAAIPLSSSTRAMLSLVFTAIGIASAYTALDPLPPANVSRLFCLLDARFPGYPISMPNGSNYFDPVACFQ